MNDLYICGWLPIPCWGNPASLCLWRFLRWTCSNHNTWYTHLSWLGICIHTYIYIFICTYPKHLALIQKSSPTTEDLDWHFWMSLPWQIMFNNMVNDGPSARWPFHLFSGSAGEGGDGDTWGHMGTPWRPWSSDMWNIFP